MKNFSVGEIVSSTAGRDDNELYVIYKVLDNKALLVNGNNKTFLHPKNKNLNHIISHNHIVEVLNEKFTSGKQVFDAEVYSALKKFKENNKGE